MNLYKIIFSHHAPKDSEYGIKAFVLAENDEQVYNWIASNPKTNEGTLYNSWKNKEEEGGWWNDEGESETFKERMLRLKGEIEDDSVDFSDSYYGITLLGWELLKEDITTDYSELIELGEIIVI